MAKKMWLASLVLIGSLCGPAVAGRGKRDDITMLVVPRESNAVRIAHEMEQRFPVLLVTYQQEGDQVRIHAWSGTGWVSITEEDYFTGSFFRRAPSHMILVEDEADPAPDVLIPDGTWLDSANRLLSTDPRVMLHLLGRYFDLPYGVWRDLTWRYHYELEEINPGLINIPWWHFRGQDVYRARVQRNLSADMEKWLHVEIHPPVTEPETETPEAVLPGRDPEPEPALPEPEPEAAEKSLPADDSQEPVLPGQEPESGVKPFVETEALPVPPGDTAERDEILPAADDPFSAGEILPAEVIEPRDEKPRKSWWKLWNFFR